MVLCIALLSNQAAMAQYLAIIYDSSLGTQVAEGAVQKRFQQTPANQLQAANDAEAAMAYCRDEVLPELVRIPFIIPTWSMDVQKKKEKFDMLVFK